MSDIQIHVFRKKQIPQNIYIKLRYFIFQYIAAGTVVMDPAVYDEADYTAIIIENEQIMGFSALRVFNMRSCTLLQIMATFLDKNYRGKKYATLLLQGKMFLTCFFKRPFSKIYWCTRTRVPQAYAAAQRYHAIYPRLNSPEKNQEKAYQAKRFAIVVYGDQIEFNQTDFVMKNSYKNVVSYCPLPNQNKKSVIQKWVMQHIDYAKNEAIFIYTKLNYFALVVYVIYKGMENVKKIFHRKIKKIQEKSGCLLNEKSYTHH